MKYLKYHHQRTGREQFTTYVQIRESNASAVLCTIDNETGEVSVHSGTAKLDEDREWEFFVTMDSGYMDSFSVTEKIYEITELEFLTAIGAI